MLSIDLPPKVGEIISVLQKNGFEAFVVGGCVRDSLLAQKSLKFTSLLPKDWDIATSATPLEAMEILQNANFSVIPTGIEYGTISVISEKKSYEITTYRIDGEYRDSRKPKEVFFVQNLSEDLSRRDFSINAMAYHPDLGLIDPYGGERDLQDGIITAVGDPKERFKEDALRILRGLRFASRFGFEIHHLTKEAMFWHKELLSLIAKERIKKEFEGIVCGEFASNVLREYAPIIDFVLQNLSDGFETINNEALEILPYCSDKLILCLLALFYNVKVYTLQEILKGLKYDKKTQKAIIELVQYTSLPLDVQKNQIKKYLQALGVEKFNILLEFKIAQNKALYSSKDLEQLTEVATVCQKILKNQEVFLLKDLCINGEDIKKIGIKEGKEIKKALQKALDGVINEEIQNSKTELLNFVQKSMCN